MFTGIIEITAKLIEFNDDGLNREFTFFSELSSQLVLGQSIAHNGVCLTVTRINSNQNTYNVTAIDETLQRTNLGALKPGDEVNIERSLTLSSFLDGHLVQGHVDTMAVCENIQKNEGSWLFQFKCLKTDKEKGYLTVEKGSVTVNGVSLTVVSSDANDFSVAVIPYTFQHTIFHSLKLGDKVNIEFDIIGKYLAKMFTA